MLARSTALRRIAEVREVSGGTRNAYLLRTRLHRLLLALQRSIASEYGLVIVKPLQLDTKKIDDPRTLGILSVCNKILLESEHLSSRSEELDERWEAGWHDLEHQLAILESLICDESISTSI